MFSNFTAAKNRKLPPWAAPVLGAAVIFHIALFVTMWVKTIWDIEQLEKPKTGIDLAVAPPPPPSPPRRHPSGVRHSSAMPEPIENEEFRAAFDAALLAAFNDALAGLETARRAEGEALKALLLGHIDVIEGLTLRAEADPSREPALIRQKLAEQVRLLMDASANLDESRLHMEAAFLATKADIREEIDRLKTHVASARSLLGSAGAVGRKLDFLAQEFNRESNTLCSKSNAATVTAIGLELKAVVDQFREQVQNLE